MDVKKILISLEKKFPQKPAIIFRDQPISFSDLKDKSFRLANSLIDLGLKKQDKIAIYLPNWPEYIFSYLAIFSAGLTAVPLDFMFTQEELISCLTHSETKVLITKEKPGIDLEELKKKIPSLKIIISLDKIQNYLNFQDLIEKGSNLEPKVDINDKDKSIIFYTSGTTGRPKGVLLNYKHLDASPAAMDYFVDLNNKDVKICALPFSHAGGLVYLQNCIVYGITLILMKRFMPVEFLKNIEKYRVTCFHLVPSMYYAILHLKEFEKYDLTSLRWVDVFGAPSAPDALKRFHQYCPNANFLNGWGLTETNAPNVVTPMGSNKIESIGKPAPWIELKIVDDQSKKVAIGQVGELIMRSWVVMEGYYNDQEATNEVIKDGWFYTGDLARVDQEGFFYIVGRKREIIKVGGELVYAPEVEAAIHKHPGVTEVAVIGVPDKLRGEQIKAFVVLKEGFNLDDGTLRLFCREHLAHFKIPSQIEFRNELPKNRTGKIDKNLLKV
ncbi:MAG: AMP-binding protein [Candidatus Omnitrophota bacterium]